MACMKYALRCPDGSFLCGDDGNERSRDLYLARLYDSCPEVYHPDYELVRVAVRLELLGVVAARSHQTPDQG
jgi:hypothetical protein